MKIAIVLNCCITTFLTGALAIPAAEAETFVIQREQPGHEATVKIPVGAITTLTADFAESLSNTEFESMRLTGDVVISIAGSAQPIQIQADSVVLELTPDVARQPVKLSRSDVAANKLLRSTSTLPGDNDSQVFVGNVVFDLQTPSGPMQIKADRVEHRLQPGESAAKSGA